MIKIPLRNKGFSIGARLKGTVQPFICDAAGRTIWEGRESDNLITDVGMDMPATYQWANLSAYGYLSTGSTTPSTSDTTMESLAQKTSTYSTDGGATTLSGDTVTWQRDLLFPVVTAATTFTKFGCSPVYSDTANMFAINAFDTPIELASGQRAKIRRKLSVTFSPYTTASTAFSVSGLIDSSSNAVTGTGTARLTYGFFQCLSHILATNATQQDGAGLGEPSTMSILAGRLCDASALAAVGAYEPSYTSSADGGSVYSFASYTSGSYTRSRVWRINLADCNMTAARSIMVRGNMYYNTYAIQFQWLCDYTFAKLNTHLLDLTFTLTWARA
jgi:hypothetical protein